MMSSSNEHSAEDAGKQHGKLPAVDRVDIDQATASLVTDFEN